MTFQPKQFTQYTYFRGRVALAEILRALDIGEGDLVAIQAFTCVAVPEAVMAVGARPIWIDVEEGGTNMSAQDLDKKWHSSIKAVVVQHTFGMMANMNELGKVINDRVPIIEDCCHTYLSSIGEKPAGTFGIASFYSFEWGKPLVLGAGGAAVTENRNLQRRLEARLSDFVRPDWAKRTKLLLQFFGFLVLYRPSLYWFAKSLFRKLSRSGLVVGNYNPIGPGQLSEDFSTRMSKAAETKLRRKLNGVERDSKRRRELAQKYRAAMEYSKKIQFVESSLAADDILIRFPVLVDDKRTFLRIAEEQRIEAAEWYATPVHPLSGESLKKVGYVNGDCPNAEYMSRHLVSFPLGSNVSDKHITQVAELLAE